MNATFHDILLGRRKVFITDAEITEYNVKEILNFALGTHILNLEEEEYLYWYRRGFQPILERTKKRNDFINNKVVENHADEIVEFKNGYFLTQPAFYTARSEDKTEAVKDLNEYLYRSNKQVADNKVVDWFHTVGVGVLFVKSIDDEDTPVVAYSVDPRQAFVAYSLNPGNEPLMGVNMVVDGNKTFFDVYTKNKYFKLSGGSTGIIVSTEKPIEATAIDLLEVRDNPLGEIPIIEYRYNALNMGAFESVIPLLNAINIVMSNRADGVEQFIQSLAVAVNCQFDDETTLEDIKKRGIIALKSTEGNKADFRILTEQLDQTQTQVLVDYMYEQVLRICSMPSTTKGGVSTSDTGAAVLARDGWYQADAAARNTEDLFKESNKYFDRIFLKILKKKKGIDLSIPDFELSFVRNETANVQSKAQALQTLLAAGLNPELAFAKSGISNDPVNDVKMSEKWLNLIWGDPKVEVIEKDTDVGEPM